MKYLTITVWVLPVFFRRICNSRKPFETCQKKQSIHKVESYKLYILFEFCSVNTEVQYEQHSTSGLFVCLAVVGKGRNSYICQYCSCLLVLGGLSSSRTRYQQYQELQDETTLPSPLHQRLHSPARASHLATTQTPRESARSTTIAPTP